MKSITTFVCGITLAAVVRWRADAQPTERDRPIPGGLERILEGAAEHGAKGARSLQTIMPGISC
jgi:hypothetical protein